MLLRCLHNATELCMPRDTKALIFETDTSHHRGHLRLRCRRILGFLAGSVPRIGLRLGDVSVPRHAQQFIKRGNIDSRGTTTNVFDNCLSQSYDLGISKAGEELRRSHPDVMLADYATAPTSATLPFFGGRLLPPVAKQVGPTGRL